MYPAHTRINEKGATQILSVALVLSVEIGEGQLGNIIMRRVRVYVKGPWFLVRFYNPSPFYFPSPQSGNSPTNDVSVSGLYSWDF